jgi:predicted GNAT superfamily acetyltransferase
MTELKEVSHFDDIRQLAELLAVVWGRPGSPPIGPDVLKALAHSGNYVVGAYQDRRMIGGLVGWLGGDPRHELHMHSHILGVLPGRESFGLGFELKQHQRTWCLERGVKAIEWTTDPLVRRNGYFNLTKLGARAPEYLINVYGEMRDGINAGEESDRLLVRWRLDSHEAKAAAGGEAKEPDVDALMAGGAEVVLSVGDSGKPAPSAGFAGTSPATGEVTIPRQVGRKLLLMQVPKDIVALRRENPAVARAWRVALRDAVTKLLAAGYEITGATRDGWYVLELQ